MTATGRRVVPLAYVNTTLALKAVVGEYGGAVCTSANAETMLRWALARGDGVLFLPDKHLGRNTAKKLGIAPKDQHILKLDGQGLSASESRQLDRPLLLWPGCCAIHARLKPEQAAAARAAHPGCRITAHPECRPELIDACDAAGSTSFLIADAARIAEEAPGSTLIIGTENNLVDRLAARMPALPHPAAGSGFLPGHGQGDGRKTFGYTLGHCPKPGRTSQGGRRAERTGPPLPNPHAGGLRFIRNLL